MSREPHAAGTMTSILTSFTLLFCIPALATAAVTEIKQKNIVDLLSSTDVVYEAPKESGFSLRVIHYDGDGECDTAKPCTKDKLIFVTSTYDEYPERKAFEAPFSGTYNSIDAVSVPKKEDGKYLLRILSEMNGIRHCSEYSVGLNTPPDIRAC